MRNVMNMIKSEVAGVKSSRCVLVLQIHVFNEEAVPLYMIQRRHLVTLYLVCVYGYVLSDK